LVGFWIDAHYVFVYFTVTDKLTGPLSWLF